MHTEDQLLVMHGAERHRLGIGGAGGRAVGVRACNPTIQRSALWAFSLGFRVSIPSRSLGCINKLFVFLLEGAYLADGP